MNKCDSVIGPNRQALIPDAISKLEHNVANLITVISEIENFLGICQPPKCMEEQSTFATNKIAERAGHINLLSNGLDDCLTRLREIQTCLNDL